MINTAIVKSSTADSNLNNNTATEEVPVLPPSSDVFVTKKANLEKVLEGDVLTYTIVVENKGIDTAKGVELTDNVPSNLSNVAFSIDGGVTWNRWVSPHEIGALAVGASKTILIRGIVTGSDETSVINTAKVSSKSEDPVLRNNTETVETPVIKPVPKTSDVLITKKVSSENAKSGDTLTYTMVISNQGKDAAENVMLVDDVPENLSNVEFSTNGGATWSKWVSPYAMGTLENGISKTILIRGIIARKRANECD